MYLLLVQPYVKRLKPSPGHKTCEIKVFRAAYLLWIWSKLSIQLAFEVKFFSAIPFRPVVKLSLWPTSF